MKLRAGRKPKVKPTDLPEANETISRRELIFSEAEANRKLAVAIAALQKIAEGAKDYQKRAASALAQVVSMKASDCSTWKHL